MSEPNPAVDCYYVVEVNLPGEAPVAIGSFLKVTGLTSEVEAVEYKAVRTDTTGDLELDHIPGRAVYSDVVLSHAVTGGGFWKWQDAVKRGTDVRVDLTITVYGANNQEVARWNVFGAWPRKINVSELGSGDSGVLVEEITLAHSGIEFDDSP
jgi:phage tail-like protein